MSDKKLSATDEVALIKGLSKNLPESHANVNTMYALGAAYILNKAIRNVLTRP
jgi:hypothetical protein